MVQALPQETLVYDRARHRAHCLNRTAALVWRHCDGKTGVRELAERVARETGLPRDEAVVWLALERLAQAQLLEEGAIPPRGGAPSRRQVLKKLGAAGGLALLLPAVASITSPEAAQAASPVTWQNCQEAPGQHAGKCCSNVNPRRTCVNFRGSGLCTGSPC